MAYRRPAPVTQRDGSSLQFSNCRMAAGATGIDGHSNGAVVTTGASLRARQNDQSGGTGSDDLRVAWASYKYALSIPSGVTWASAVSDLAAGREVMLDVWHASAGGPCLSGSGAYGHTMIVHPERSGSDWLTSDPWCKPAKWQWWPAAKLQAGAEEWGRRVRRESGGTDPSDPDVLEQIVKRLMNRWRPDRPATGDDADTGGAAGGPIYYTRTRTLTGGPTGGDDTVGIYYNASRYKAAKIIPVWLDTACTIKVTEIKAGTVVTTLGPSAAKDADGFNRAAYAVCVSTGALDTDDTELDRAILWIKGSDMPTDSEPTSSAWDNSIWSLMHTPAGRFPCPEVPPAPPVDDLASRQKQWDLDAAAAIGARPK